MLRKDRGYAEWDISSIDDAATITKVEFRYHGKTHHASATNADIRGLANQPTTRTPAQIMADIAAGTAYLSNDAIFPEVGATKDVGGASGPAWDIDPKGDLESALGVDWFALGFKTQETESPPVADGYEHRVYSEDKTDAPTPKPTLYVEYSVGFAHSFGVIIG